MDDKYCLKVCEIGKQKSEKFLATNNSAYDAAMDMHNFVEKCKKTCPYRNNHKVKED